MPPPPGARRPISTAGSPARDSATSAGSPASTRRIATCWPRPRRRRRAEGVVAVADEQTAGRGRHGRTWSAAPGAALLVSVLLRPAAPARAPAPRDAGRRASRRPTRCARSAGSTPQVKWPNDLVVDDRKLAGILAEADGAGAVVVGMGLNLRADAFPAELARRRDRVRPAHRRAGRPRRRCSSRGCARSTRSSTRSTSVVAAAAERSATLGRRGARRARARARSPASRRG